MLVRERKEYSRVVAGEESEFGLLQRLPNRVRLFPGVEPTSNEDYTLRIIFGMNVVLEVAIERVEPKPRTSRRELYHYLFVLGTSRTD